MSVVIPPPPRIALKLEEAAAALGVGDDFFREHVKPDVAIIRRGRVQLVPVGELERWAADNAERLFEGAK